MGTVRRMAWEDDLARLFDDLEAQAEALFDSERAAELGDRSRAEYAQVTLASRLMASVGADVTLQIRGVGGVQGRLSRVGPGWCLVSAPGQEWVLLVRAVTTVAGASTRSVPEIAWSPVARLGLASALRRIADTGDACVVHLRDGSSRTGRLTRVGGDFAEIVDDAGHQALLPFHALSAVRRRGD